MENCNKLRRDLAMFIYIYLNMDECWLSSSMPQQRFKLQLLLKYAVIPEFFFFFWRLRVALKVVEVNWFPLTYILANLITNSIHAWLTKDYRSSGMIYEVLSCEWCTLIPYYNTIRLWHYLTLTHLEQAAQCLTKQQIRIHVVIC